MPTLVLRSDGTFTASDLPAFSYPWDVVQTKSGDGKWHLIRKDGGQQIQIDFDGGYDTQLMITGSPRSPGLFYWLDDPDAGHRIEWVKR